MSALYGQLTPYPDRVGRWLLRLPLLIYQLGLGDVANAARIMVLTTRGRKTGLPRHTPIEYRRHGSKIYVVSVWGEQPHWYQNLRAHEPVTVQQGHSQFSARAQLVTNSGEALLVLHLFRRANPLVYDAILRRMSEREDIAPRTLPEITDQIVIVRLMPEPGASDLPPVPNSLVWVWPVGLALGGAFMLLMWTLVRSRRTARS
jgi:deazaflavin-dependent oxidoreductase (nitroreductase family)